MRCYTIHQVHSILSGALLHFGHVRCGNHSLVHAYCVHAMLCGAGNIPDWYVCMYVLKILQIIVWPSLVFLTALAVLGVTGFAWYQVWLPIYDCRYCVPSSAFFEHMLICQVLPWQVTGSAYIHLIAQYRQAKDNFDNNPAGTHYDQSNSNVTWVLCGMITNSLTLACRTYLVVSVVLSIVARKDGVYNVPFNTRLFLFIQCCFSASSCFYAAVYDSSSPSSKRSE